MHNPPFFSKSSSLPVSSVVSSLMLFLLTLSLNISSSVLLIPSQYSRLRQAVMCGQWSSSRSTLCNYHFAQFIPARQLWGADKENKPKCLGKVSKYITGIFWEFIPNSETPSPRYFGIKFIWEFLLFQDSPTHTDC